MWKVRQLYIPTDRDIGLGKNHNISDYYLDKYDDTENGVYVYLAIASVCLKDVIMPKFEVEYLKNVENEKIIKQKTSAYALLKYAVKDVWGIDEDFSSFAKTENGKPYTDRYKFSISHCANLICVAVSKFEVGVDIEFIVTHRRWNMLAKKIVVASEEINNFDCKQLTNLWTKKEAIFKLLGKKIFVPKDIDTNLYITDTINLIDNYDVNSEYFLSIATQTKTDNYLTMLNKLC